MITFTLTSRHCFTSVHSFASTFLVRLRWKASFQCWNIKEKRNIFFFPLELQELGKRRKIIFVYETLLYLVVDTCASWFRVLSGWLTFRCASSYSLLLRIDALVRLRSVNSDYFPCVANVGFIAGNRLHEPGIQVLLAHNSFVDWFQLASDYLPDAVCVIKKASTCLSRTFEPSSRPLIPDICVS